MTSPTDRAVALYERALDTVIPVSSPEAAELYAQSFAIVGGTVPVAVV